MRFLLQAAMLVLLSLNQAEVYAQNPETIFNMPTDARGYHLFQLNPTAVPPRESKVDAAFANRTKTNKIEQTGDNAQKQSTEVKENMIGVVAMADMGAGASAGVSVTKTNRAYKSTSDMTTRSINETLQIQTIAARMIIELIPNLRAGIAMRYMFEDADMVGTFRGTSERVIYKGKLVGYASGINYRLNSLSIGAAYAPVMRGKAEILAEDKILTEPGYTYGEIAIDSDKMILGLSYIHWLHKRDERAGGIRSTDGNATLDANGVDFDKNLFPVNAIQLGLDWKFSRQTALRLGIAQHKDMFIFSTTDVPDDRDESSAIKYNQYKAAIQIAVNKVNVSAGFSKYSRSSSLGANTGRTGQYSADGNDIFGVVHAEF